MKIAKFKRLGEDGNGCFESIDSEGSFMERHPGYVRLTEYTEVEFTPLHTDEIVQKQLDALDKAESELRNKFQAALSKIETQREELRAITYQS